MSLKDIFCQDSAIDVFQRAIEKQRMGHAYIFAGIEGVGKFKTAIEWAKVLLCQNQLNDNGFVDSCGRCKSCELIDSQSHPDFVHVYKELYEFTEKGKNSKRVPLQLPIDVIREYLIEKVSSKPSMGERTIYVVSETEKLNAASQNAMLKVLEEPPGHCLIILLCTSMEALLPTTRSRCQVVRFHSIDRDIIVESLGKEGVDEISAGYWAGFCNGSLGSASVWNRLEAYDFKKRLIAGLSRFAMEDIPELTDMILANAKDISAKWSEIEPQTSKSDLGRRVQKAFIQVICSAFSDAMKVAVGGDVELINADQRAVIGVLADKMGAEKCSEQVEKCYQAIKWVDSNVNERLVYERLLLELAK